jgi:hypothetical protein
MAFIFCIYYLEDKKMFYEESAINQILLCKVCDSKLNDPRILPCGQSVCAECVVKLADTSNQRIKCLNCGKAHEIPHDGFPENKALVEITKLKSSKVSRCQLISQIKQIIEDLGDKSLKVESCLEIGETTIRNKCDKARNDVQLTIEEAHLELDKSHKSFMDEINSYEEECRNHLKTLKANKTDDVDKFLARVKEFQNESIVLLDKNELDQIKLENMLNEAKKLMRKIQKVDAHLECDVFNNKDIYFYKKNEVLALNHFGSIKTYERQTRFRKNESDLVQVNLSAHLNDCNLDSIDISTFSILENGNIFMAYKNLQSKVNLCLFDCNGNVLKKVEECFETQIDCPAFDSSSNESYIYLLTQATKSKKFELRRIDQSLNVKKKIGLYREHKIHANNEKLLILDLEENVIDRLNLLTLEVIDERVPVEDNFEVATSFFLTDDSCVIARKEEVTLCSFYLYGRALENFEVEYSENSPNCFCYLGNYIVSHDQVSKCLNFYNEDGIIVDDVNLERLPADVKFIGTQKEKLYFFDKAELKIYYF